MCQAKPPPTLASLDLSGKTVIVTGANTGLGLESARQYLVSHAARVILAVRTLSKGEAAAEYLSNHPTVKEANPTAEITVMELDLDDYQSVYTFTEVVKQKFDEVDIVLLNGGVNLMNYQTSKSGHERVMQVNYYSSAMLALELLPLLEATAAKRGSPSRLTVVGSETQTMASITNKPIPGNEGVIAHFDNKATYSGMLRYSDSKLLVSAFVQELALRVPATKVIINNICPGPVATGFNSNLPLWLKPFMFVFMKLRAKSAQEGARILVSASAVMGEESHGQFISLYRIIRYVTFITTPARAAES